MEKAGRWPELVRPSIHASPVSGLLPLRANDPRQRDRDRVSGKHLTRLQCVGGKTPCLEDEKIQNENEGHRDDGSAMDRIPAPSAFIDRERTSLEQPVVGFLLNPLLFGPAKQQKEQARSSGEDTENQQDRKHIMQARETRHSSGRTLSKAIVRAAQPELPWPTLLMVLDFHRFTAANDKREQRRHARDKHQLPQHDSGR